MKEEKGSLVGEDEDFGLVGRIGVTNSIKRG